MHPSQQLVHFLGEKPPTWILRADLTSIEWRYIRQMTTIKLEIMWWGSRKSVGMDRWGWSRQKNGSTQWVAPSLKLHAATAPRQSTWENSWRTTLHHQAEASLPHRINLIFRCQVSLGLQPHLAYTVSEIVNHLLHEDGSQKPNHCHILG